MLAIIGFGWFGAGGCWRGVVGRWVGVGVGLVVGCLVWCGVVFGAQGHSFGSSFGVPCAVEPCGPGTLKEPDGLALNTSSEGPGAGDVYVVDHALGRVERFDSAGTFLGEFAGPSGAGSGSLVSGSSRIEGVVATSGAFTVGEELTAPGLPAKTMITVVPEPGVLEVSQPATASELAVLSASQTLEGPTQVAVDSSSEASDPSAGDVYVIDRGHLAIDKYTPEGEYLGQITGFTPGEPFTKVEGVAVDPTGQLWVAAEDSEGDRGVAVFDNAVPNVVTGQFFQIEGLSFQGSGLALAGGEAFYAHYEAFHVHSVYRFVGSGVPVREVGFAGVPLGFGVEPGGEDLYVSVAGGVERFAASDSSLVEKFGAGHLLGGGGVAVNAAGTVFVADGAAGVVDVFPLEVPGAPTVESVGVADVSASSATFTAGVNPRGAASAYHFEYGRCPTLETCSTAGFEASVPAGGGTLPADFLVHDVPPVHVQGLVEGSAYHVRVLASSTLGAAEAQERTFTTQSVGGGTKLLDGRQWELVSPADKHGALVESIGEEHVTQASADGQAFTFLTDAPTEPEPKGYANLVQVLAGRGAGGWQATDIAGPHVGIAGFGRGQEFRFFSEDLGVGVIQPIGAFTPGLSAAASEQTAFLRETFIAGNVDEPCINGAATSCYAPLVSGCPAEGTPCAAAVAEHANIPAGTVFGEAQECPPEGKEPACGPQFVGASPDSKHIVLTSKTPLTAGALPESLYEWSTGHLTLISVLPDDEASGDLPVLGLGNAAARGAVSDDGSRVVWSQGVGGRHLFLRDVVRGETVELDAVQGGSVGGGPAPEFQFASRDGSRVFFTDSQPLTADSGASGAARDLFMCEVVVVGGVLSCVLSDLTPVVGGVSADVRNEVLGGSGDGSTVYFVANGVLAPGAKPGGCVGNTSARGAGCSLYVWHEGTVGLVARLSADDYPDWNGHDSSSTLARVVSRVSGDGRWLVFMSDVGLGGFDTRSVVGGAPVEEVYLFDLARGVSGGGGGVAPNPVCVSCDPGGGRPTGVEFGQFAGEGTDGGASIWGNGQLLGGSVPAWDSYMVARSLYQSRFLSGSGRVFFNSADSLVAGDVNGVGDVYEFEPVGVGGCVVGGVGFSGRLGGCLGLVSSGEAGGESGFLDASVSGGDVFFFTSGKLSGSDFDQSRDVYDAHECSVGVPCLVGGVVHPGACDSEESCKGSPGVQPDVFGVPASGTFSGAGNPPVSGVVKPPVKKVSRVVLLRRALRACQRKRARRRVVCVRRARARFGVRHTVGHVRVKMGVRG